MDITDLRIKRTSSEGKLMAYVTITFDECFVVHNIKIISGQTGPFVAMPSRKTKSGEYKDIAHPINSDFRAVLQRHILAEYDRLVTAGDGVADQGRIVDQDRIINEDRIMDETADARPSIGDTEE